MSIELQPLLILLAKDPIKDDTPFQIKRPSKAKLKAYLEAHPRKRQRTAQQNKKITDLYQGAISETSETFYPGINFHIAQYALSDRNLHIAEQSSLFKGTCGGGVSLMIALDILAPKRPANDSTDILPQTFLETGYKAAQKLRADAIVTHLKDLGIEGQIKVYCNNPAHLMLDAKSEAFILEPANNKAAVLDDIQKTIATTGNSVILAITHKKIDSHWIIVDQVTDDSVFIRDPYTAKAYKVSIGDLLLDILAETPTEFSIYFP